GGGEGLGRAGPGRVVQPGQPARREPGAPFGGRGPGHPRPGRDGRVRLPFRAGQNDGGAHAQPLPPGLRRPFRQLVPLAAAENQGPRPAHHGQSLTPAKATLDSPTAMTGACSLERHAPAGAARSRRFQQRAAIALLVPAISRRQPLRLNCRARHLARSKVRARPASRRNTMSPSDQIDTLQEQAATSRWPKKMREAAEADAAGALDYATWAVDQARLAVLAAIDARTWADAR